MNNNTWDMINERFQRRPQARAAAIAAEDFDRLMAIFKPNIDPDYREFVLRYGGGIVGADSIYGLRRAEWMGTIGGKDTAPDITQWFRDRNWPGIRDWLIFTVDQGGNPIGLAPDQTVWLSDQLDFKQIVQVASGFEDYLLKWCLKVRKLD
jgi:hypothetical protein